MNNTQLPLMICTAVLLVSGCANHYRITYDSEPRGATLICGDINYGYTPVSVDYVLDKDHQVSNQLPPRPVMLNGLVVLSYRTRKPLPYRHQKKKQWCCYSDLTVKVM